jgi:hypothetical protein
MTARVWNVGVKVENLDAEVEFHRKAGNEVLIAKDSVPQAGRSQSQALIKSGDKYLVISDGYGWENALPDPLGFGVSHVSYSVDNLDEEMKKVMDAGAKKFMGPADIAGSFGSRRVACFTTPGGMHFCMFQVKENKVPEV